MTGKKKKQKKRVPEDVCLMDDIFMTHVFRNRKELVRKMICTVMEKPDIDIESVSIQHNLKRADRSRGVILDVFAVGKDSRKYNIEIQGEGKNASFARALYHFMALGIESLDEGCRFDHLPDIYIIFVTKGDYLKSGLPLYHIEFIILEKNEIVRKSKVHIIYVNGSYKGDDRIGHLVHDLACSDYRKMYIPDFAKAVRYYKNTEGGKKPMRFLREIAEEMAEKMAEEKAEKMAEEKAEKMAEEKAEKMAEEKAREKIRKERKLAEERLRDSSLRSIRSVMDNLKCPADRAMDILNIPMSERETYYSRL